MSTGRRIVPGDRPVEQGKGANNIDEQELDVKQAQVFVNEKLVYEFVLKLTPEKAREIGIKHRSALAYLKKKGKEGKLNFKSMNVERLMKSLQWNYRQF